MAYGSGDDGATERAITESVARFRTVRDDVGGYTATGMAGLTALSLEDYDRGSILIEEAIRGSREAGDTGNATMPRTYSAAIPLRRGGPGAGPRAGRPNRRLRLPL